MTEEEKRHFRQRKEDCADWLRANLGDYELRHEEAFSGTDQRMGE